jgi:indoleamine 2,3-dioxygenase
VAVAQRLGRPRQHWQQHPVMYEGVPEYARAAQAYYGETGAQSTIMPCLDAVLGVQHRRNELRDYLVQMRRYMPRGHVAFLEALERALSVRAFVAPSGSRDLRQAYDDCVELVEGFRFTGGTPFMRYLKKHHDETHRHRLNGVAPGT